MGICCDNDWVKICTEYEVEGARPRSRPKRTWREAVQKDCQEDKLNRGCVALLVTCSLLMPEALGSRLGRCTKEIGLVMGTSAGISIYLPVISYLNSCMCSSFRFVSLNYSIVVYLALYIPASYPY